MLQTPKKGLQRCFLASQRGFEPPTPRLGAETKLCHLCISVYSRVLEKRCIYGLFSGFAIICVHLCFSV